MTKEQWQAWETKFAAFLQEEAAFDAGHTIKHTQRVVANAKRLASAENGDLAVVIPAAWLHDCVSVPKNSPQRSQASRMAAEEAGAYLRACAYPATHIVAIEHAIAAHSFTAQIPPETIEAKIVQDADRLEAIGAIGIARCLMVGVEMGSVLYDAAEPFPFERDPDDSVSMIDHFYTKLLRLAGTMQTEQGRIEAERRTQYMREFLLQLGSEIGVSAEPSLTRLREENLL